MSQLLRPVGPERSSVYWRRRVALLVLLAALVLVVLLVVRLATSGDGSGAPTEGTGGQTGGQDAHGSADSADGKGPTSCGVQSLQVTATADAGAYAPGSQATLGVSIRNVGDQECLLDVGSAAIELVVVSGEDRIWSSDDCQQEAVSAVETVPAGAELASAVTWALERSAQGCPQDLPPPRPGTYQLTGRVGDIVSNPLVFTIS